MTASAGPSPSTTVRSELDASVLNIPLVGFLPGSDERVTGTIDAIARELGRDGFVSRYSTAATDDGLTGDEGQFLACSFWLVSALAANGRTPEARVLFERLLTLANDLGLLAEEYDVGRQRQVGNFPQAFSHLTLVLAAHAITTAEARAADVNAEGTPEGTVCAYRHLTSSLHRPVRITVRDSTPVSRLPMAIPTTMLMTAVLTFEAVVASAAKGTTIAATVASPTIQPKNNRGRGVVAERRWATPVAARAATKAVTA